MKRGIYFMVLASVLLASSTVLAGNFIAFQGNVKEGGINLGTGNLSVLIYNAQTGGSLIYNSGNDFNGTISDGEYDVMLGNGSNELVLEYGTKYFLEMYVNGESFSFDGNSRQVFESAVGNITYVNLESNIPTSYINKSAGTYWLGSNVESILDIIYGWIGGVNSSANIRGLGFNTTDELSEIYVNKTEESNLNVNSSTWWAGASGWVTGWFVKSGNDLAFNDTKLNATITQLAGVGSGDINSVNTTGPYLTGGSETGDVDLYLNESKLNDSIDAVGTTNDWSSTYNSTYDSNTGNVSWNQTLATSLYAGLLGGNNLNGSQSFNGGWGDGGLSIIGGNLFAQTVYVYNLSSLSVNELNINSSMLPSDDFDGQFDIGSAALRWKDLYMSGSANISGNLSLGEGIIMWNASGDNYVYYNGSDWQELGSSSVAGIWENNSGVATYPSDVNITGNLTLGAGIIKWNSTGYIYFDGTNWNAFGGATTYVGETVWKQYVANSSDGPGSFNITATDWTTTHGVATPYQVQNDSGDTIWRMRFNIVGVLGSGTNDLHITLSGVTFYSAADQAISSHQSSTATDVIVNLAIADSNSGILRHYGAGTTNTIYYYSGDVELDSKPDWADEPSTPNTVWTQNNTDSSVYYNTGDVKTANNITLGQKITFALGAVIDNIANGWLKITGNVNVTGQLQLGNGSLWYNDTDDKYYYFNKTEWNVVGSGSGTGAFTEANNTATYDGNVNITGNLSLGAGTLRWNSSNYIYYDGSNWVPLSGTTYVGETVWKQYVANSSAGPGQFNVTATDWTTTRGVVVPYQVQNDSGATVWRMKFNIHGAVSTPIAAIQVNISGATLKTGVNQGVVVSSNGDEFMYRAYAIGSSNRIYGKFASTVTNFYLSGDVELDSKPDWADEPSTPGSVWVKNTTDNTINYASGNVGINKTTPEATLHVSGDVIIEL